MIFDHNLEARLIRHKAELNFRSTAYSWIIRLMGMALVSEHAMAELQQLDVGYGYTADKGHTFPL